MCGIAGAINYSLSNQVKSEVIESLRHRGPDSQNSFQSEDGNTWLAHTRLSIIDLTTDAAQPMSSDCGRWKIVFNGEIYNYIELRNQLIQEGCEFQTKSDTEVFLVGLAKYGPNFQLRCNGMWAFCLWDSEKNETLFGRDRFGKKPLFYAELNGGLVFASEMKAMKKMIGKACASDIVNKVFSGNNIFKFEYLENTVIKGISKILPGHYGVYKNFILEKHRWWCTLDHLVDVPKKYDDQVKFFRELLIDAVRIRMRSDVAIGTGLSGGLDSSSIVSIMKLIKNEEADNLDSLSDWQHCFCSSYSSSSIDESNWAKKVCDHLDLKLNIININPKSSKWSIEDSLSQVEDPYITIPIPHLETYEAMSNAGIKVSIDGHGVDELFCGYDNLLVASSDATFSEIAEIVAIQESTITGKYHVRFGATIFKYYKYLVKKSLLPLYNKFKGIDEVDFTDKQHLEYLKMDSLTKNLYEIFHITILPTLLRNYDRYSMSSGVEIRMPFMDHRIVCFLFSLPWKSKVGSSYTKRLLRDAMKGIVINDVIKRREKIGWNAPLHEWFKDAYSSELTKYSKSNLFDNKIRRKINKFRALKDPKFMDGQKLWRSILPTLWKRAVLDKDCT